MARRGLLHLLTLLAVCVPAGHANAQTGAALSAEDRALLERLALAKARAELVERVWALALDESTSVRAWAMRSETRDRALHLWLRTQPRSGPARFFADSTCDVDVRLDPETLRDQLEQLRQPYPADQDEHGGGRDLRRAAAKWPVLWGAGTASLEEKGRADKPEGWEDVTYEGIKAARRAAEADARHALLDKAAALPVTNARSLREFLESGEAVRQAVLDGLERAATLSSSDERDQVVVTQAKIGRVELIRLLTDVHARTYQGELFHAADFREMARLVREEQISATGLGLPPPSMIMRARYRPIELDTPAWVSATLAGVGRCEPGEDDKLTPEARAEAARLDGMDRLRQQVEALVIQKDVTVTAFLGYHEKLKDDVILFLSGTRVVGPAKTLPDGTLEVPVELPLRRLWWIVRRGMERKEIDPSEVTASQPAEKGGP